MAEQFEAENLARTINQIRRYAERGKTDHQERALLHEMLRGSVFYRVGEPHPAVRQGHGQAVADAIDAHNDEAARRALHGWRDEEPAQVLVRDGSTE